MQKDLLPHVGWTPQSEAIRAYNDYIELPALTPAHQLNTEKLESIQGRLSASARANHIIAASWVDIELAYHPDLLNDKPAAASLFDTAAETAIEAIDTIDTHYSNDPCYIEMLYRGLLLNHYTGFFRELGPVRWPDEVTSHQTNAYADIQETILNPLISDYEYWRDETGGKGDTFAYVKGALGEVVVLQALNRIHTTDGSSDWAAVPASTRENFRRGSWIQETKAKITNFDTKIVFRDQRFVPMQVKWHTERDNPRYDERVAMISAYIPASSHPLTAAKAMRDEVAGTTLLHNKRRHIHRLTAHILEEVCGKGVQGTSVFRPQDPRAAATDQLLAAFKDKSEELFAA